MDPIPRETEYRLRNLKVGATILAILYLLTLVAMSAMDIVAEHVVEKREKCKLKMASFAMSLVVVVFVGSIAKIEACLSQEKWSAILTNWRKLTILVTALVLSSASTTEYLTECVAKEKRYGIPLLIIIAAAQCIVNFIDLTDGKRTHCRGSNSDSMEQGEAAGVELNTSRPPPNASSLPPSISTQANQAVIPSQNSGEPAPGGQLSRSPGSLSRQMQPQPLQTALESNPSMFDEGPPDSDSLPPPNSTLATQATIPFQYECEPTPGGQCSGSPDIRYQIALRGIRTHDEDGSQDFIQIQTAR